ncbi:MAG: hypothetical protein PHR44_06695 [Candidatus Omnitrophica bacterium]|nr:hypothetical protein [Candidatus Omnitrophota bacterium]
MKNIRIFLCALALSCFAVFVHDGSSFLLADEASGDSRAGGAEAELITLDFKEADIKDVLRILSYKARVNIVPSPEVIGLVTIRLVDVPWKKALETILKNYGFAYEAHGNIITVAPIEKLTAMKQQEVELEQVQQTQSQVFKLKFLDAQDAKRAIEPQLSPRGKVTVLEMTGQAGWKFGTGELAKRTREAEQERGRSKVLIVSDIPPVLEKIREIVADIDVAPKQVYIETRIMEVSKDKLRDLGVDLGTGSTGVDSSTITSIPAGKSSTGQAITEIGGHTLGSQVAPSSFGPKVTDVTGVEPFNLGLQLVYKKLSGSAFEAMVHALEEDVNTNTLSAPRILALSNQEAAILVGTKYPILKSEESTQSSFTVTQTLDYYQDIGIQLNVLPQIGEEGYINMILHPAITSYTQTVGTNLYPIINTREAETRVLMKDGETIVLGGLLKDVKGKTVSGVPFLRHVPLLGLMFQRTTHDWEKIDLLIFITARIVKEGEFTEDKIAALKDGLGTTEEEFGGGIDGKRKKKKKKR